MSDTDNQVCLSFIILAEAQQPDAAAIIADTNERNTAAGRDNLNVSGPGIKRVFNQLFDHARRPLDHFAGGNAIDGFRLQLSYRHGSDPIALAPEHVHGAHAWYRDSLSFPRQGGPESIVFQARRPVVQRDQRPSGVRPAPSRA